MNNLLLALAVFAAATLTWINRHTALQAARHQLHATAGRLSTLEAAVATERAVLETLNKHLARSREEAQAVHQQMLERAAEAQALTSSDDEAGRDAWPAARDYFYLPKQYLNKLGYGVFHNNGSLSEEAARLFGLTPAEKVALTGRWRELRSDLTQLQLEHAERIAVTNPETGDHREISYRLPALTNEIAAIKERFAQQLVTDLGQTRGTLLWEKVSTESALIGYPLGDEERIITFEADRAADGSVRHTLGFSNASHTSTYSFGIAFGSQPNQAVTTASDDGSRSGAGGVPVPLSPDSALWNYRHLFGDQPLLLPQEKR